jgi:hypothetical protein
MYQLEEFELGEMPNEKEYRGLQSGELPITSWRILERNDQLYFYDEEDYEPEYLGDTLPITMDSLANISSCRTLRGELNVLKLTEGWLIGSNQGEWGGALTWFSEDLKQCKLIGRMNVNQIYRYGERVLVLEGLSHLSISGGTILEYKADRTIDTLADLDEAPYSLDFKNSEKGYLISDLKLYEISSGFKLREVYSNDQWPYMYPTDLKCSDGKVYISMRGGIAIYDEKKKSMKWLRKK